MGLVEASGDVDRPAHAGHLGDVVQHDSEAVVVDTGDHGLEVVDEPLVGRVLQVEGGQHQGGGATRPDGVAGEVDRVGDVGESRAGHQQRRIDATVQQRLEGGRALVDADGQGLSGGTEGHQRHAPPVEQSPGVFDVAAVRNRTFVLERGEDRRREPPWERREGAHVPASRLRWRRRRRRR